MKRRTASVAPADKARGPREIELGPLSLRADVGEVNDEERTVELVFTTGAGVVRYDWAKDERYLETLSLEPEHVRLGRLNAGGPVLDSHGAWSVSDVLGAVVPGSATLSKKEGRAKVRFSKRASLAELWQDIKAGIVRNVSVGYRIYKFEETAASKANAMPVRKAVDWEPFEISMVPIPADAGAGVRGQKPQESNRCLIVPKGTPEGKNMKRNPNAPGAGEELEQRADVSDDTTPAGEGILDERNADEPTPTPAAAEEPNERDEGALGERARVEGIRQACAAARMPRAVEDKLINGGVDLTKAQAQILAEVGRRNKENEGPSRVPAGEVVVGDDPLVHKRRGMLNALLHRVAPSMVDADGKPRFPLSEEGRQYRGLGVVDMARVFLHARGIRTGHMSKMDMLSAAMGPGAIFRHDDRKDEAIDIRAGLHTTSDFPLLLADVQGKVLRAAYGESPQTWLPISRRVTLRDFKPSKQLQIGEAPGLLKVLEHGEFKRGTITEGKEEFQLATYGRIFGITRQALINDDLDAFSQIATAFGRAARRLESDLAWEQITSNPTMGDGVVLFHTDHANLAGAAAAIGVDSLGVARAALRKQTGIDGESLLNLAARYLIVPAGKETLADQYTSANFVAATAGNVNPFAGRLTPIAEPRLDVNSATAWYLAASPDQVDILLHGVLEGQEGPAIETRVGFDVDGLEIKARLDTAFKVADHRGLFKNTGA